MRIKVIGKARLSGTSKKTGKPYDFVQIHYTGKARGVDGLAAITLSLDPRDYPLETEFYRIYENAPGLMRQAVKIGWTQNVVILEAELTKQIHSAEHLEIVLDCQEGVCYTEPIENSTGERK